MIYFDSSTLAALLTLTAATLAFWTLIWKPRLEKKKPFANLPMAKGSHAIMGHLHLLTGSPDKSSNAIAVESANELGRTGYWQGNKPSMAFTRWQDARAILNAESHRDASPAAKAIVGYLVPKSLLFLNGREWKHHRAAVNKSFTPDSLYSSREAMVNITERTVESLKARIAKNGQYQGQMEPLMKQVTLDIFGQAAFSYDFECTKKLETTSIAAHFDVVTRDNIKRAATGPLKPKNFFRCIPTEDNIKLAQVKKEVRAFVDDCIKERQQANASNKKKDLLTYLIDAGDSEDVTPDVLTDVIITVLFAGYDTTSITLTYALHEISKKPEVEANMIEEIKRVSSIGDYDNLVYCRAVIQEALRLYPPAISTARTIQKDVKLSDGFVVPAGTSVLLPIWAIHHSEDNFARPMEFHPERWVKKVDGVWVDRELDDTSYDIPAGNPKAFFAFSGGGRSCPGMKFAYQEASIVLAGLVKDLKFELEEGYELTPQRMMLIQHPDDKLPMKVTLREE